MPRGRKATKKTAAPPSGTYPTPSLGKKVVGNMTLYTLSVRKQEPQGFATYADLEAALRQLWGE